MNLKYEAHDWLGKYHKAECATFKLPQKMKEQKDHNTNVDSDIPANRIVVQKTNASTVFDCTESRESTIA